MSRTMEAVPAASNNGTDPLPCPICGAGGSARTILPKFNGEPYGHIWCTRCRGSYDSNVHEIRAVTIDETLVKSVNSVDDYRALFVETWEIENEDGEIYSEFKWVDNTALREGVARHILDEIARHNRVKSPKILDVGCGSGFTTQILARTYGPESIIGLDPSPMILEMTRSTGVPGIQGTLESVRFGAEQFDIVVMIGNIMLHPDVAASLKETHRILKPGGIVIFDFKNIRSASREISRFLTSVSRRIAMNHFVQRNFLNMRYGLSRAHLPLLLNGFEVLNVRDKAPRLLEFGNQSHYQKGLRGIIWRLLNSIDSVRRERAWIQVTAKKPSEGIVA